MKIKTSELKGKALNWAVRYAEKNAPPADYVEARDNFSACWAKGGPIIEREKIQLYPDDPVMPKAILVPNASEPHFYYRQYGTTPLIAAMRCFVASELGDEVDVPEELA